MLLRAHVPFVTAAVHDLRHASEAHLTATICAMHPHAWLLAAGYGTWLVTGLPTLVSLTAGGLSSPRSWAWVLAFAGFGVAFGFSAQAGAVSTRPQRLALLGTQTLCALAMVWADNDALIAATLVVVAGQLMGPLSARGAGIWVLGQSGLLVLLLARGLAPSVALTLGGAYGGFQLFALATSALALSERRAREALAKSHAELHATRAQLAEQSRLAERLRISRDLHDTVGHHLTALSLQLDVASRLTDGKASGHLQQAHAITRLLLSDVRDVVSRLRDSGGPALQEAVRALARAHAGLAIHLDMSPVLTVDDEARAEALCRCVQEIMTNAARHSGASNLWIALRTDDDGILLNARDDGRGTGALQPGHGLTGLRERFEQFGGRIEFRTAPARGFEVRGCMPLGRPS